MTPGASIIKRYGCGRLRRLWQPYADELDRHSLTWCRDNRQRIIDRVAEAARQQQQSKFNRRVAESFFDMAIRETEAFQQPQPVIKPIPGQAFRDAFYHLTPPPLPECDGRGIVIAAGGWRFFASLYVTVKMIRDCGCELPIEVWYLGDRREFHPLMAEVLPEVSWVDGNRFVRENPAYEMENLGGWELKALAAIGTRFAEFLFLDADAYPVFRPEEFLDASPFIRHGACYFADMAGQSLQPGQWARFGLGHIDEPAWESGQFAVDKRRHWDALYAAWWLNSRSPYVYQHIYGDKDTFHLAFRKTQHRVWVSDPPDWQQIAFVHRDHRRQPFVVHRTRDKFRFPWIRGNFMTAQNSLNTKVPGLPKEEIAHGYYHECLEQLPQERVADAQHPGLLIVGPPRSFTTQTFRILSQALQLPHPGVEAGEILNHTLNSNAPTPHFTDDAEALAKCHRILANHRGEVIKDVAQPLAIRSYVEANPDHFKLLHIARDADDVRRCQLRAFGEDGKPHPREWEAFYREIADEVIAYDEVIRDSHVLWDAVERLGFRPQRFDYIDAEFRRKRTEVFSFLNRT